MNRRTSCYMVLVIISLFLLTGCGGRTRQLTTDEIRALQEEQYGKKEEKVYEVDESSSEEQDESEGADLYNPLAEYEDGYCYTDGEGNILQSVEQAQQAETVLKRTNHLSVEDGNISMEAVLEQSDQESAIHFLQQQQTQGELWGDEMSPVYQGNVKIPLASTKTFTFLHSIQTEYVILMEQEDIDFLKNEKISVYVEQDDDTDCQILEILDLNGQENNQLWNTIIDGGVEVNVNGERCRMLEDSNGLKICLLSKNRILVVNYFDQETGFVSPQEVWQQISWGLNGGGE